MQEGVRGVTNDGRRGKSQHEQKRQRLYEERGCGAKTKRRRRIEARRLTETGLSRENSVGPVTAASP